MDLKHLSTKELNELLSIKKADIKEELRLRKESNDNIPQNYKEGQCFINKNIENDIIHLKKITLITNNVIHYQYIRIDSKNNNIEVFDNEYGNFLGDMILTDLDEKIYDKIFGIIQLLNDELENKFANIVNTCINELSVL